MIGIGLGIGFSGGGPTGPIPTISGLTQTIGRTAGGDANAIAGTNLGTVTAAWLVPSVGDPIPCTLGAPTATSVPYTTPAAALGTYSIRVQTSGRRIVTSDPIFDSWDFGAAGDGKLWLNDTSTLTMADTKVDTWGGLVASNSVQQTTDANRPTVNATGINNRRAIAFASASSQWMLGPNLLSSGDYTIYMTYRQAALAWNYLFGLSAASRGLYANGVGTGNVGFSDGTHAAIETAAPAAKDTNYWVELVKSGTTYTLTLSNGTTVSGTLDAVYPTAPQIGRRGSAQLYFNGLMGEVAVAARAYSAPDQALARRYLKAYWGTA